MQDVFRRIKKIEPLIRMRKSALDEESAALEKIRSKKITVVQQMKENQRRYMEGVQHLNEVRMSRIRENLETLEGGLDLVKADWERLFREVRQLEGQEKAQMSLVLKAHTELRTVEKLKEKYEAEFSKAQRKSEQDQLDEHGLRRFTRRD